MIEIDGTVAVVGDVMLDVYINGEATRISPEAPVPIVSVTDRTNTLGGAGNVALNLVGLGCEVHLFGVCGNDAAGRVMMGILDDNKIKRYGLYIDQELPTTTKTRIVANHQQLIRFDDERIVGIRDGSYTHLKSAIPKSLSKVEAVVLSDYGKGVLSPSLIKYIIENARVPVLVDPKRSDWSFYSNATVITPNISELEAAIGEKCDGDDAMVLDAAKALSNRYGLGTIVVTRGPKGMLVVTSDFHKFIPTVARTVFDVSGAGDTVIATMAACMCSGYSVLESAKIANAAAGIVVGKLGTCPIKLTELLS